MAPVVQFKPRVMRSVLLAYLFGLAACGGPAALSVGESSALASSVNTAPAGPDTSDIAPVSTGQERAQTSVAASNSSASIPSCVRCDTAPDPMPARVARCFGLDDPVQRFNCVQGLMCWSVTPPNDGVSNEDER